MSRLRNKWKGRSECTERFREQVTRMHAGEKCACCGRPATRVRVLKLAAHEQTMKGKTMGLSVPICDRCGVDPDFRAAMNRAADEILRAPVKQAHVLHDDGEITKCTFGWN